jgi:multidrug resistance efflux pump
MAELTVSKPEAAIHEPRSAAGPELWNALEMASTEAQFAAAWLALQCSLVPGVRCGVAVLGEPDTGPFAPVAFWPQGALPGAVLTEAADQVVEARAVAVAQAQGLLAVAHPLIIDGHLHGLVALELPAQRPEPVIQALRWGLAGIEARLRADDSADSGLARERLMTILNAVSATLGEEKSDAAADSIATDLATRLDCDRVSVGFRHGEHVEVIAISHTSNFGERMNLIAAIAAAMDEAIDQNMTLCLPQSEAAALVVRDHAALARQHGSGCVLTIPFLIGKNRGAFTFERSVTLPFGQDTIELCQGIVALCSRILATKRAEELPLAARLKKRMRAELENLLGEEYFVRKLVAVLVLGLLLFSVFAQGTYRVGSVAQLEGAVRRVVTAPYEGYLDTAQHRAGDIVTAGTVLATFDTRDVKLEYLKAASLNEQYARQAEDALAQHDRAGAGIYLAQAQQAKADMDLRADQIARSSIVAPFDGIVVSGDFSQSLGSGIKRGQSLFEISPLNAYRVILEVEEGEIDNVRAGQHGNLVLASLPGETFPLTVTLVTPVTNSREGHSFFRVEAALDRLSPNLRPGMEGVAKIEVGSRRYIWIWTHRLVNWLRITAWTWL